MEHCDIYLNKQKKKPTHNYSKTKMNRKNTSPQASKKPQQQSCQKQCKEKAPN